MPEEFIKDAATIDKLRQMAGIEEGPRSTHQVDLYKFAERVLALGCQAMGTEVMCSTCRNLAITPPMCQRRNDTIDVR